MRIPFDTIWHLKRRIAAPWLDIMNKLLIILKSRCHASILGRSSLIPPIFGTPDSHYDVIQSIIVWNIIILLAEKKNNSTCDAALSQEVSWKIIQNQYSWNRSRPIGNKYRKISDFYIAEMNWMVAIKTAANWIAFWPFTLMCTRAAIILVNGISSLVLPFLCRLSCFSVKLLGMLNTPYLD